MLAYLIQGITLGFTAGVSPGPLQAYFFSKALEIGWKRTLPVIFAPLVSDGPIVFLVLLVLLRTPQWFLAVIQLAGGGYLIYLGWKAFEFARTPKPGGEAPGASSQKSLIQAVFINLLNPNPYIFWSTILGPIIIEGWRQSPLLGLSFLIGFYGTMIGVFGVFVVLFSTGKRASGKLTRLLNGLAAIAFWGFGLVQLFSGIARFS